MARHVYTMDSDSEAAEPRPTKRRKQTTALTMSQDKPKKRKSPVDAPPVRKGAKVAAGRHVSAKERHVPPQSVATPKKRAEAKARSMARARTTTPAQLRLGTYLIDGRAPSPDSDSEDELLIVGPLWSSRVIRSAKKRKVAKHRPVPGRSNGLEQATRKRVHVPDHLPEEPQDTFVYTKLRTAVPMPLFRSPSPPVQSEQTDLELPADRDEGADGVPDDMPDDTSGGQDQFVWEDGPDVQVPEHHGELEEETAMQVERAIESLTPVEGSRSPSPVDAAVPSAPTAFHFDASLEVDENADTLIDEGSTIGRGEVEEVAVAVSAAAADELATNDDYAETEIDDEEELERRLAQELRPPSGAGADLRDTSASSPLHDADAGRGESSTEEAIDMDVRSETPGVEGQGGDGDEDENEGEPEGGGEDEDEAEGDDSGHSPRDVSASGKRLSPPLTPARSATPRQRTPSEHSLSAAKQAPSPVVTPAQSDRSSRLTVDNLSPGPKAGEYALRTRDSPARQSTPLASSPHVELRSSPRRPSIASPLARDEQIETPTIQDIIEVEEAAEDDTEVESMMTGSSEEVAVSLTIDRLDSPRLQVHAVSSTPARFGRILTRTVVGSVTPPPLVQTLENLALPSTAITPTSKMGSSPSPKVASADRDMYDQSHRTERTSPQADQELAMDQEDHEALEVSVKELLVVAEETVDEDEMHAPSPPHTPPAVKAITGQDTSPAAISISRHIASPAMSPASRTTSPYRAPHLSTPPSRNRQISEHSPPKPRQSLSALMESGEGSSDEDHQDEMEIISGLVSPTMLALASPATAKRLQSLSSVDSITRSRSSPAYRRARVDTSSPEPRRLLQDDRISSPRRSHSPAARASPLAAARSSADRQSRVRRSSAMSSDDQSLRDTPVSQRTHPRTPLIERNAESDDSLRDTPVSMRTQRSIHVQDAEDVALSPITSPIPSRHSPSSAGVKSPYKSPSIRSNASPVVAPATDEDIIIVEMDVTDTVQTLVKAKSPTPESRRSSRSTPGSRRSAGRSAARNSTPATSTVRVTALESPIRVGISGDLDANDLLVDDTALYSRDAVDASNFSQPQPLTAGDRRMRASATPEIEAVAIVEETEVVEMPDTIYPPDVSPADVEIHQYSDAAVVVRDPDSVDAATFRRSSLGARPPTPGRFRRGSVYVAKPGTSPESSRRLSPVLQTLPVKGHPNLRVILQAKRDGVPRTARPASTDAAEFSVDNLYAELQRVSDDAGLSPPSDAIVEEAFTSDSLAVQLLERRPESPPTGFLDHSRRDRAPFVEIRSSDPGLAARVAALLKVEHRFTNEDNSADDSMQAEQSLRLLKEAELEVFSQIEDETMSGLYRRSVSPYAGRSRSVSLPAGSRSRQTSHHSGGNVDVRIGDSWTKDDWRRLEVTLREEIHRSEINGTPPPENEEIVDIFLLRERIDQSHCEHHWSLQKLADRVEALRRTRWPGSVSGAGELASRASSVAFEQYSGGFRARSAAPSMSTPHRATSAPPKAVPDPPNTASATRLFGSVQPPTASIGAVVVADSARAATPRRSLFNWGTPSVSPHQGSNRSVLGWPRRHLGHTHASDSPTRPGSEPGMVSRRVIVRSRPSSQGPQGGPPAHLAKLLQGFDQPEMPPPPARKPVPPSRIPMRADVGQRRR